LIQPTSSALDRAASTPPPPGNTTVSTGSRGSGSGAATSARPVAVVMGWPPIDATTTSYPRLVSSDAPANTSCGPTTSSACTPGKPAITTLRAMNPVLARPGMSSTSGTPPIRTYGTCGPAPRLPGATWQTVAMAQITLRGNPINTVGELPA